MNPNRCVPKFSHDGNQKIDFQSLPGNISGSVSGNKLDGESQINHNITVNFEDKELQKDYRELLKEHHIMKVELKEMKEKLADVYEKNEKNRKRYYELTSEVKDLSNKKLKEVYKKPK